MATRSRKLGSNLPKPGTHRMTFDVADELRRRVRRVAVESDRTIRQCVVAYIESGVVADERRLGIKRSD